MYLSRQILKSIWVKIAATITLSFSFSSIVNATGYKSSATIAETVAASGGTFDKNSRDFDLLFQAVSAANLFNALSNAEADLTVLAPNDRAFIRLARDLGYEGRDEEGAFNAIVEALTVLGNGDPIPTLTNVLLYHVSPDSKSYREIRHLDVLDTLLEGEQILSVRNQLIDADPDFKNPRFQASVNIQASNGTIHTINRVLIPVDLPNSDPEAGTIADIVAASGGEFDSRFFDYDILLNAIRVAGLEGALADTAADLTVFAPNDIAFIRLARALGYHGFNEKEAFNFIVEALTELGQGNPVPVLSDILLYHVSPGSKSLKSVVLSESVSTLLNDATIGPNGRSLEDAASQLRDPKLSIRLSDIRAKNGLIHTINRVLIPLDL